MRSAIGKCNLENSIDLGGQNKTIYEWLIWKREIAMKQVQFLDAIHTNLKQKLDQESRQPQVFQKPNDPQFHLAKLLLNLDYGEQVKRSQELHDLFEQLDGKLSLKNATLVIEI